VKHSAPNDNLIYIKIDLHTAFLQDLREVYDRMDADLFVAYTADPDWEVLKPVFPRARGFFPQEGADLGEKMYNALSHVLKLGYEAAILTGADLPLMKETHLEAGFSALDEADVAIGPTSDGGYYLIGMKVPHEEIFRVSGYGGETALENTLTAGQQAGLEIALTLPCDDVDTPEDLRNLTKHLSPETATYQYLMQLKKEGVSL
jgi:rSAM/selenodomain-associated transferase 1